MAQRNDGGQAFPSVDVTRLIGAQGMSVRQVYKAAALTGCAPANIDPVELVRRAERIADAAIAADEAGS